MDDERKFRIAMIGGILGVVLLAVIISLLGGFFDSGPDSDEDRIRRRMDRAFEEFEDQDWEALVEYCWPPEKRAEILSQLKKYGFLKFIAVQEPLDIARPDLDGETATCEVSGKWASSIGGRKGTMEALVRLVKRDGEWYIDYGETRKTITVKQ